MSQSKLSQNLTIDDVFQYLWPPDDEDSDTPQEYWVVQETFANFLQIKSFKRRYPDLTRRVLGAHESQWLVRENLVSREFADLGLTAIKADEAMELLQREFPGHHGAVHELFSRRRIEYLNEKQKRQYQAARVERSGIRAENARKKAMRAAREYNKSLVKDRANERSYYWDLQTMQIHVPRRPIEHYDDSKRPPTRAYPLAVIPGQFSDFYRTYSPRELKYLPLNHALYAHPLSTPLNQPPKLMNYNLKFSRVAIEARREEALRRQQAVTETRAKNDPPVIEIQVKRDSDCENITTVKPEFRSVTGPPLKCTICGQMTDFYVKCSECMKQGHPKCMTLPPAMVPVVLTYAWACIDCKICTECGDSGEEDLMMFCDRCDRGFHAFCVGLKAIPDGRWECPMCTGKPCPPAMPPPSAGKSRSSGRKRPPSTPKRQQDDDTKYTPKRRTSTSRRVIVPPNRPDLPLSPAPQ